MPKVNTYTEREDRIRAWVAVGILKNRIKTKKDLAKRLGLPLSTFTYRLQHPETFRLSEVWRLEKVLGKMEDVLT